MDAGDARPEDGRGRGRPDGRPALGAAHADDGIHAGAAPARHAPTAAAVPHDARPVPHALLGVLRLPISAPSSAARPTFAAHAHVLGDGPHAVAAVVDGLADGRRAAVGLPALGAPLPVVGPVVPVDARSTRAREGRGWDAASRVASRVGCPAGAAGAGRDE